MQKWVKVLVAILIIGNIVGWFWCSGQRHTINECWQLVAELRWENEDLSQQNDELSWELSWMADELKASGYRPVQFTHLQQTERGYAFANIMSDSRFWNKRQDVDEFLEALLSMRDPISEYDIWLRFSVLGEWDAIDVTKSYWEKLKDNGIISVIAVGNLDSDNETLSECNHSWLLVPYRDWGEDGWNSKEPTLALIFEPTQKGSVVIHVAHYAPKQYQQGYFYISPIDLEADMG